MPWELLWKGKCRLYFNSSDEVPFIWSLDDGDIENEYKGISVHIHLPGFKTAQRKEDDIAKPKVGLEHPNCAVYRNTNKEYIVTYR